MTTKTTFILQNIFGILLLLLSIPMLAEGGTGIIGGLFMIIGGLVSIPRARQVIEERSDFKFSKPVQMVIIAFGWLSIGIFSKPVSSVINKSNVNEQAAATPTGTVVPVGDTLAATNMMHRGTGETITPQEEKPAYASGVHTVKENRKRNNYSSGNAGYTRGPRGGCYYINASGKKVYVDRSYCN